jgi:hypothetical protein
MNFNVAQALIGIAGCVAVGIGVWVTQSADCLWALVFVGSMISNASNNSSNNDSDD